MIFLNTAPQEKDSERRQTTFETLIGETPIGTEDEMNEIIETRRMKCPYCGYEYDTNCIGAVHCGPHYASFGSGVYPAVQMVEKEQSHSENCECADCWENMEAGSKV